MSASALPTAAACCCATGPVGSALETEADGNDEGSAEHTYRVRDQALQGWGHERDHVLLNEPIRRDHLAGHPTQQPAAEPNQDREPVDQPGDQAGADHKQRYRESQADDEEFVVSLGGARHSDDVVEAHHGVGHHDGPDRLGQAGMLLDGALILLLAAHELDRDMQQDEATGHLQQGHRQQLRDDDGEDDPQQSRRESARKHADPPLPLGQAAAGHGNDHRICRPTG